MSAVAAAGAYPVRATIVHFPQAPTVLEFLAALHQLRALFDVVTMKNIFHKTRGMT
ncbi:MAG: hypothetical protein L0Y45_11565 [Woeseiaceae bacterium]|nr:hypothetical protein [Woeseiaceae bacterium]